MYYIDNTVMKFAAIMCVVNLFVTSKYISSHSVSAILQSHIYICDLHTVIHCYESGNSLYRVVFCTHVELDRVV